MNNGVIITERAAAVAVGSSLIVIGLGFFVLGLTWLPVIGLLFAVPILLLAWQFLGLKRGITRAEEQEYAYPGAAQPSGVTSPDRFNGARECPWPPSHKKAA
jgi:hypothetical protein